MKNTNIMKKLVLLNAIALGISTNLPCKAETFQFDLFKQIAKGRERSNLLVSPYSVETAMTMTALGASGSTFESMSQSLDLGDSSETVSKVGRLSNDLKSLNAPDPGTSLKIVNSLIGEKSVKFDKGYVNSLKEKLQAPLSSLDFSAKDSVEKINNFVKENSGGKIASIIDKVDPSAKLYLINAIYFKSSWADKFDPQLTAEKSFHTADEQMVKVPTMVADRKHFKYFSNNEMQALRLHYKNGRYSMLFFLPAESSSLTELENNLSESSWQNWLERFNESPGKITLPRFKITDNLKLKSSLKAIGMSEPFDSLKADFSKMVEKDSKTELFLSEVFHKTFIDVSEEGTEAAASTAAEASAKALHFSEPYFEMKLNRPFLFALHDAKTNRILFLGHIAEPRKK